jgi:hypothetical protein
MRQTRLLRCVCLLLNLLITADVGLSDSMNGEMLDGNTLEVRLGSSKSEGRGGGGGSY